MSGCKRCGEAVGGRVVTLLGPFGDRRKVCGPYCDEDTDGLLRVLPPTYSGTGDPCYVIEPATAPTSEGTP